MGDDVKITVIATGFREEMPQRRERMLQGAALPASRVEPPPPPRIAQRPPATPAPFASEIHASAEEHELPVNVQEKPAPRKKGRESVMSVVPEREPVAVQPPPPPPPRRHLWRAWRSRLRVTPPAEPLRITPSETPRATSSEPLRVTPSEPLRVPNEPLRITPPREPEPERMHGAYVPAASAEPKPELVPVPASVFDDDFFRQSNEEQRPCCGAAFVGDISRARERTGWQRARRISKPRRCRRRRTGLRRRFRASQDMLEEGLPLPKKTSWTFRRSFARAGKTGPQRLSRLEEQTRVT